VLAAACSGTAVVDQVAGVGGASGSGSNGNGTGPNGNGPNGNAVNVTVGSSGGPDCEALNDKFAEALADAMACNSCTNELGPCSYEDDLELTDLCGCLVPVHRENDLDEAVALYKEWLEAGCGPIPCNTPCAISSEPACSSVSGCDGVCAP